MVLAAFLAASRAALILFAFFLLACTTALALSTLAFFFALATATLASFLNACFFATLAAAALASTFSSVSVRALRRAAFFAAACTAIAAVSVPDAPPSSPSRALLRVASASIWLGLGSG